VTMTPRKAAIALVGTAFVYMVASLLTGRSARAELPPDLSASAADAALDVWKAAYALAEAGDSGAVVDLRPPEAFASYHLPRARSLPGATAADLAGLARTKDLVLLYAGKDDVAAKLAADARALAPRGRIHYLPDGARAWYLALTLPVPLFAEGAAPDGYADALATTQGFLERPDGAARSKAVEAIQTLARLNYQPSLLQAGKKAPAAGGARKKIAGGCG
jgi:rhodanese-related sulfurtransferase